MKPRLNLHEILLYGAIMGSSLTLALATSPLWPHIPDVTGLLPPSYADTLAALPFAPNTSLAFVTLVGLSLAALFILKQPIIGLAILTSSVLAVAAYPYGRIYWHRVFLRLPLEDQTPTLGAWLIMLLPVLLLLIAPVVLQVRILHEQYKTKGIDESERRHARAHLFRSAITTAGIATAFSIGMGLILFLLLPDLRTSSRWLVSNSLIVMAVVALLLVLAIGIGTGVFRRAPAPPAPATPTTPPGTAETTGTGNNPPRP